MNAIPDAQIDERTIRQLRPPCEVVVQRFCAIHLLHVHPCGHSAEWVIRTPCNCGTTEIALVCASHIDEMKREELVSLCMSCGQLNDPARMTMERI